MIHFNTRIFSSFLQKLTEKKWFKASPLKENYQKKSLDFERFSLRVEPIQNPKSKIQNRMMWGFFLLVLVLGVGFIPHQSVMAASTSVGDLSRQEATEVTVSLGNEGGELKFFPNHLEFEAGKRYKLVLKNPSPEKHYFTAKDFADVSWTQKVESGKLEVKGAIHDLELKPGGAAEWVFVPIRTGTYGLRCSIPGHTEAGMTGEILIN